MSFHRSNLDRLKVQMFQHILSLYSNALLRQLGKTFIHIQSSFRSSRRVVESSLIRKQRNRELPEFGGVDSFNSKTSFMGHGRRRMPGLNLMTEYEADSGIVSLENGKDVLSSIPKGGVYLVELVAHD